MPGAAMRGEVAPRPRPLLPVAVGDPVGANHWGFFDAVPEGDGREDVDDTVSEQAQWHPGRWEAKVVCAHAMQ